jgi:hypothetical protein
MLSIVALSLALSIAVSGAPARRQTEPCTFIMNSVGEPIQPNGTVQEDTIGDNRIGGEYPRGVYYFTVDDSILYDSLDHICIIDSNSFRFQCVTGVSTTDKFTIGNSGYLAHNGSENWLACPDNDGSYLIYSDSKADFADCEPITLRTGGYNCTALGRPSSTSAILTPSTTPTSIAPLSPACPTDISSGNFQFPHLIVPTSPTFPDYPFGNSFKAYISRVHTTLFNFDVPTTYSNLTCALLFLFPFASDEDPSAGGYYFSGMEEEVGENGGLDFALLSDTANSATTYTSTPPVAADYGMTQIFPGEVYTLAQFPCPAGQAVTYSASSRGNVELDYFQDSAPSPIGLYMVPCTS